MLWQMSCMRGREKEPDLVGGVRIKSTGRLIQKENPRISHQSDANVCPLALPSCIVISYEQCQVSAAVISPFQILALERGGHHSSGLNITMETKSVLLDITGETDLCNLPDMPRFMADPMVTFLQLSIDSWLITISTRAFFLASDSFWEFFSSLVYSNCS